MGELDHRQHGPGIITGQDHPGGLHRHICTRANRNTDLGPGQGRGVIDTVADHGHAQTALLQLGDLGVLVLRQNLGEDLIDPQILAHCLGDLGGVTGDHRHLHPAGLQGAHRRAGFGADLVLDGHGTDDLTVADDVEHSGTSLRPGTGDVGELTRDGQTEFAQHVRPTHEDLGAIDSGPDPAAGGGGETGCAQWAA